jgi:iron complex outermembrane receptor protein
MKAVVLLFAAVCLPAAGETRAATLAGKIADPSGALVPEASVTLTNRANGRSIVTRTDRNGRFEAGGLAPGSYDFTAEAEGFAAFSKPALLLPAGDVVSLNVTLNLPTLQEQVLVTAKAPPAEAAAETTARNSREVLEIREVRESAARDVGEAIADLAGLWKIRKGGIANDLVLRGFQQGNINVLIDGQRIYGACPSHMDPSAYHVDFAEIEAVEVTKGPFDVRNQGSLGGSINIVNKTPQEGFHITPAVSFGSFGFYNPSLVASMSSTGFHTEAGFSYRRSDSYTDGSGRPVTAYANYLPGSGATPAFEVKTGWLRLGVMPARNQSADLSFTHQDGATTLYPALQMDSPYDKADRLNAVWTLHSLTGIVKLLRAQAYFSDVRHWMTDQLRTSAADAPLGYSMGSLAATRAIGGRVEAQLPDTVVGLEVYNRRWNVTGSMRMGGMYIAQKSLPDVRITVGGVYIQHARRIGKWRLTLGGRFDAADSGAYSRTLDTGLYWAYHNTRSTSAADRTESGNVTLTRLLPKGVELFAGAGSAVRLPDPEERYYSVARMGSDWVGNPTLQPTRNNEVDLGINLRSRPSRSGRPFSTAASPTS